MSIEKPISSLKGIGPRRSEALGRLGLFSLQDLFHYAPRGYEDYSKPKQAAECAQGEAAAIPVKILAAPRLARPRKGLDVLSVRASDGMGNLLLVWFNQSYRKNQIQEGESYVEHDMADNHSGDSQHLL